VSDRRSRTLGGLVALALAARLIAALAFPVAPAADAADYHQLGLSLSSGQGFSVGGVPASYRPPLYPLFLAGIYAVFGAHPAAVRVAQALVDIGTCLLLYYWVGRRFGEKHALLTFLFAAISISAIASVRVLLSECVAAFLVTLTMVLFDELARTREPLRAVAVGIVAGLLTLTRGIMVFLPLFLAALLLRRRALVLAAVMVAAYALTLAPWLVRNQRVLGEPVLTTQGGLTFYSSHFRAPGQPYGVLTRDEETTRAAVLSPLEQDHRLTRITFQKLSRDPLRLVRAIPVKLLYLLVPLDWEVIGNRTPNPTFALVMLLAIAGLRSLRDDFSLHALLPLGYLMLMAILFYGSPRFRLPAEPLLCPLAVLGALRLLARVRSSKARPAKGSVESTG
jgi:4-amino-4-deoxy-L-arabinose transferase-like glycosyltransferase